MHIQPILHTLTPLSTHVACAFPQNATSFGYGTHTHTESSKRDRKCWEIIKVHAICVWNYNPNRNRKKNYFLGKGRKREQFQRNLPHKQLKIWAYTKHSAFSNCILPRIERDTENREKPTLNSIKKLTIALPELSQSFLGWIKPYQISYSNEKRRRKKYKPIDGGFAKRNTNTMNERPTKKNITSKVQFRLFTFSIHLLCQYSHTNIWTHTLTSLELCWQSNHIKISHIYAFHFIPLTWTCGQWHSHAHYFGVKCIPFMTFSHTYLESLKKNFL